MIMGELDAGLGFFQPPKSKSQSFFVEFLVTNFFVNPSSHSAPVSLLDPSFHLDGLDQLVPSVAQQVGHICHELNLLPDRYIQAGPSFRIITKPIKIIASLAYLTYLVVFEQTGLEIGPSLFDRWFHFCVGKQDEVISKNWLVAQAYVKKLPKTESVLFATLLALNKNLTERSFKRIGSLQGQFTLLHSAVRTGENFIFSSFQVAFSSLCLLISKHLFSMDTCLELFEASFDTSRTLLHTLYCNSLNKDNAIAPHEAKCHAEKIFSCTSSELSGVSFFLALRSICTNFFNTIYCSPGVIVKSAEIISSLYHDVVTYFTYSTNKKRNITLLDAASFFLFPEQDYRLKNNLISRSMYRKKTSKLAQRSQLDSASLKLSTTVSYDSSVCRLRGSLVEPDIVYPLKFAECDFSHFSDTNTLNSAIEIFSMASQDFETIGEVDSLDSNGIRDVLMTENTVSFFSTKPIVLQIPLQNEDNDIDPFLRSPSECAKMNHVFDAMSMSETL